MRRSVLQSWAVTGLGLALLGLSCARKEPLPEFLVGDAVPAETRGEIAALWTRLEAGFSANDPTVMRGLLVEELAQEIDAGPGFAATFDPLRQAIVQQPLRPFLEFYAPRPNPTGERREMVSDPNHGVVVTVEAKGDRAYVLLLEQPDASRDRIAGAVFVDRGGSWRLYGLRIGTLRMVKRSAQDWYGEARGLRDQGKLLPALNRITFAAGFLRPLPFVRFVKEEQFLELQRQLQAELQARYTFPIELGELPSKPRVYRIGPVLLEGGKLSQTVQYVSTLPLVQARLQSEVDGMGRALAKLFPGFCHEAPRVAYVAHSTPPIEGSTGPSVGLIGTCPAE